MDAEDRILRARVAIMRDTRFIAIGGVMMVGDWKVVDDCPTAATNGRDVLFGREFVDSIDDETLRFVILHEYYHVLFMHMTTWAHLFKENAQLANFAADAVINLMLDKQAGRKADGFIRVWEDAILDYQYEGMDTGEVYRAMMKQQQQQQQPQPQRSASGGKAEQMDEHRPGDPSKLTDSEGECEALSAAEMQQVQQAVDSAVRQAAIIAGKLGAGMDRNISNLLEVSVDWRAVLQDFVRTHAAGDDLSTWRKPSRRWMAQDMYMPSRFSESAKRITIGVDTSGSIGESQLRRALTEIVGACETVNPEMVDVMYWDSSLAAHETYDSTAIATLAETTRPKGGGGTDPGAMRSYMEARDIKPDCIIMFTDGYVGRSWGGDWSAPVLWCISTKGITAPSGVSLYVPA